MPKVRVTDLLEEVDTWTGFGDHFGHVSTGLPPKERRALLATLIAEATNLGLSRMADVCGVASRQTLLRMLAWHLREETFRSALACLTDAIHAEPLAAWFGEGWRANADGQAYHLGGPGEAGGSINAHYGRDPIVKIYTTVTDRYAPLGQTLIAARRAKRSTPSTRFWGTRAPPRSGRCTPMAVASRIWSSPSRICSASTSSRAFHGCPTGVSMRSSHRPVTVRWLRSSGSVSTVN
jgi:Tn3 transposase DDE domain